jgi:hypothetical protein
VLGGLGIPDIKLMGHAIQLRWLWLQRMDPSKPRASMPVCEDAIIKSFFRASVTIIVGNRASTLFWSERWLNCLGAEELVPDLVATVPARHWSSRTVCSALWNNSWIGDIDGPLTLPMLTQYTLFHELVDAVQLIDRDRSPHDRCMQLCLWDSQGCKGLVSFGRLRHPLSTNSSFG